MMRHNKYKIVQEERPDYAHHYGKLFKYKKVKSDVHVLLHGWSALAGKWIDVLLFDDIFSHLRLRSAAEVNYSISRWKTRPFEMKIHRIGASRPMNQSYFDGNAQFVYFFWLAWLANTYSSTDELFNNLQ